jgi:hypothetical protein
MEKINLASNNKDCDEIRIQKKNYTQEESKKNFIIFDEKNESKKKSLNTQGMSIYFLNLVLLNKKTYSEKDLLKKFGIDLIKEILIAMNLEKEKKIFKKELKIFLKFHQFLRKA